MRDVVTTVEEFFYERMRDADVCEGRIYPTIAPSGTAYPFVTHDSAFSEIAGAVGNASGSSYRFRWNVSMWSSGFNRLDQRAEWEKVFDAILGTDEERQSGTKPIYKFLSAVDGGVWDIEVFYSPGPIPTPPIQSVSEGTWSRVTHGFTLHVVPRS